MDDMEWLKSRSLEDLNGCWIWTGFRHKSGYGEIRRKGKRILAHRMAFFIANDFWPNVCRHKCDVRDCVNPDHLEDGTQYDNVRDRVERGRSNPLKGEAHGRAKVSDEQVLEIKEMRLTGMGQQKIADLMGIGQSQVSRILRSESRGSA